MSTALPKRDNPVKASRIGPKILILYSLPKVGKTEALVRLAEQQDCLIIDAERGTQVYDTTAVQVGSIKQLNDVAASVMAEGGIRKQQGMTGMDMFPYKFIALDTLDKVEEFVEVNETAKYRISTIGKTWSEKNPTSSIVELPMGGGYYYIREGMKEVVSTLAGVCPYLILIVHVKEKLVLDKMNTEVKVNDISLSGKLSSIICAMADAIGYMWRNKQGELRISFQTHDNAVMGARQKYLAGKDLPFDWSVIYPEVFNPVQQTETV